MFDVVVIGAGVVGGMIARTLSKYALDVCILEKEADVAMGATRANSAIVHAGFDAKEGSMKARMNVRGSQMMEKVCGELGVKYQKNGSLVVAFPTERAEVEDLYRRGVANGVEGLRIVEEEELHRLEPHLNRDLSCALLAETGAIVCPYELALASIGNAMDNGASLLCDFCVVSITRDAEEITVTAEDGRTVKTRYLINAAGLYADEIARLYGEDDFTIQPRRGEYMLLDREVGTFTSRTIFHTPTKMGKGILISPTVDGNLLVGPTAVDIEDKSDNATTMEGFATLFERAADNVAGLPFGKVITSFCGLRATGSTGDFILRLTDRIVTLGGIESPGLSSAPAIAEYVESLLLGDGLSSVQKPDYNPYRQSDSFFTEMSVEEKNALIAREPAYGRIVCRCEGVTEGEIVHAIHTNPPARDLDGVKRRTRSGMGRCQGGFCSPSVVAILARELNIPFESVTKFGGNSVINYQKTKGANKA